MKRTKVGGRTRTAVEEAGILSPDDIGSVIEMCREEREKIDYEDIPEHVAARYQSLSKDQQRRLAKRRCKFAPGTYERAMTYRLRYAYATVFDGVDGNKTHLFNPKDVRESSLGTPIDRKTAIISETWDEEDWR